MKRRNFIKAGLGGAIVAPVATPAVASSAKSLKLLTAEHSNLEHMLTKLAALGEIGLDIQVEHIDHGAEADLLAHIQRGDAEMCFVSLDRLHNTSAALPLFACMPFGMSSSELESWVEVSDGRVVLNELMTDQGLSFFFASDHGTAPIWSREPLGSDISGKIIGSTGVALDVFDALGANVVDITDPDFDLSSLDVVEGVSASRIDAAGMMSKLSPSQSNPFRPSAIKSIGIAEDAMNQLTPAQQTILRRTCSAELAHSRSFAFHTNVLATSAQDFGVSWEVPNTLWEKGLKAAQAHMASIFESGSTEASVVDAYIYFLADANGWSRIGEAAYHNGRMRHVTG